MINFRSKSFIIISGAIVFLTLMILAWTLFRSANDSSNPNSNSQTNIHILSPEEEQKIKEFVPLFVNLYNTYGYEDTNSALNEATYGTVNFQYSAIERFEQINSKLKAGDSVITRADPSTFSYSVPQSGVVIAHIESEQIISGSVLQQTKTKSFEVRLIFQDYNWLVDGFIEE